MDGQQYGHNSGLEIALPAAVNYQCKRIVRSVLLVISLQYSAGDLVQQGNVAVKERFPIWRDLWRKRLQLAKLVANHGVMVQQTASASMHCPMAYLFKIFLNGFKDYSLLLLFFHGVSHLVGSVDQTRKNTRFATLNP